MEEIEADPILTNIMNRQVKRKQDKPKPNQGREFAKTFDEGEIKKERKERYLNV